jgi:hypothetical protein
MPPVPQTPHPTRLVDAHGIPRRPGPIPGLCQACCVELTTIHANDRQCVSLEDCRKSLYEYPGSAAAFSSLEMRGTMMENSSQSAHFPELHNIDRQLQG